MSVDNRQSKRKQATVLVVEDNLLNRELLKVFLSGTYNIIEAEDGLDGIEKLEEFGREISLILLDVEMPRMNGYEFLEKVRANGRFASIPIIVTTSKEASEEEKCLSLGATDFVRKPYVPNILLRRVEGLIKLKESTSLLEITKYDYVTGIYTRNIFTKYADEMLESSDAKYTLLSFEIEDYNIYSDYYGEKAGNILLKHIGSVLLNLGKGKFLFSRLDPAVFGVLFESNDFDIFSLIEQIKDGIKASEVGRAAKIKYAFYDSIENDKPVSLYVNRLTYALNAIKNRIDLDVIRYDDSMAEKSNQIMRIEECMRESLEKEEFKVFYQPKVNPYTNEAIGAEALVRWIHPKLGFISPGDFIPVFEANGFIYNMDMYILEKVISDLKKWKADNISLVPISINLSRKDFIVSKDIGEFEKILDEAKEHHSFIHLELTESASADKDLIFPVMKKIRDKGICIEIDDFGSGYSALGMIKEMPMDILKLDMSFVRSIDVQKDVVEVIINLAHKLGSKVVAEGVETEEQLNILKELGCDFIQGYFYSKPLPEKDFAEYLKTHKHS